jgi:hypothetical protein
LSFCGVQLGKKKKDQEIFNPQHFCFCCLGNQKGFVLSHEAFIKHLIVEDSIVNISMQFIISF